MVYLFLPGKMEKAAVRDLNKNDGLNVLMQKVKSLYEKDIERRG